MSERDIFLAAIELPDAATRAAYLDQACAGNPGLRAKVEALLASHAGAGSFLGNPLVSPEDPDYAATRDFSADADADAENGPDDAVRFLAPPGRPDSLGRIGHYEVLQVLGRGAFGIVFRAFDDILQRVVAVKVLAPQMAATSPARKRFLREARSSAQIRHENVVQVYEVGETPLPYLVMEFIPGETLQQRLDRTGPVDPAEVVRVGRQVAEGLAAAHARDLIHRDIKPGNVLLEGPQLRVKITDFGLARAADDASISQSGIIAGTPMYMAPEQAKGDHIDHRADLFSLGSVLYQMLSGRPPFRAANTLAVLKRVCEDDPRPIRELIPEAPKWLCDIVAKLHAKNPDDRFQTAREVADVLAQCEERLKTSTDPRGFPQIAPPAAPSPAAPTAPRRPQWKWAAAGLLLPTALLAALFFSPLEMFLSNRGEVELDNVEAGYEVTVRQNGTDLVTRSTRRKFRVAAGVPVELRFFATGRENEVFRTDAEVQRGGTARVNFAAELAALEQANRARASNTLGSLGKAMNDFKDSSFGHLPQVPANYTGVPPKAIRGNDSCIAYQYSPDGKWLVTRDYANNTIGAMRVWEVATGEVRATIPNSLGRGGAFSPDSKLLAHPERDGGRVHIVVRNVGTFDVVKRWPCETKNVEGITFDRTSSVVAACVDYDVVLWTARTGAEVLRITRDFNQPQGLAFSPTADRLLLQDGRGAFQRDGRWDHNSRVHLYDVDPKSPTFKQSLHTWEAPDDGYAFEVHFSPNGAHVLFCRGEGEVMRVAIHDAKTGAKVRDIVPQQSRTQITVGAVSPDGKRVVLRHGQDGVHVGVWNLDTGERVIGFDLTGKAHRAFAVDPTFRTACIGFHTGPDAKFYDLATGKELVPGTAPLAAFTDADAKRIASLPPNEQIEAVRAELKKRNPQFEGPITPTFENDELVGLTFPAAGVTDLSPLRGVPALRELNCNGERAAGSVADLSPLKGLKLTKLTLSVNPVTDLSPLMGMPLTDLHVDNSQVADLSPLAEMPLKVLNCSYTRVTDLAPLKNLPLRILWANHTNVADLGPLKAAPLEWITFQNTKVTDTAVLKGKPLSQIYLDFDAKRDGALLRGIPTLERINDKPATEFLKEFGSVGLPFTDADVKRIAALTAAEQLEEVRRELKKRNPGYDGTFAQTIENDVVVALRLPSGAVSDLSPVRALTRLKRLEAEGRQDAPGRFSDLSQLKGLALTELWVRHNRVSDLTPLNGMPLQWLWLDGNPVTDFAPLKHVPLKGLIIVGFPVQNLKSLGGLKIESLDCSATQLADLTLLKDMPLKGLTLHATPVSDLTPLKGMRLADLNIERTKVSDLSLLTGMPPTDLNIVETEVTDLTPLKGLPLKTVVLDFKPERDAPILKGIKTLEFINRKPAADFWKELDKK